MPTKITPGSLSLQNPVMEHNEETETAEQELHTTTPNCEIEISDSTN